MSMQKDIEGFDREIAPFFRRLLIPFLIIYGAGTIIVFSEFGRTASNQWIFGIGAIALAVDGIYAVMACKEYALGIFRGIEVYYMAYRTGIYFGVWEIPTDPWLTWLLGFVLIGHIVFIENNRRKDQLLAKAQYELKNGWGKKLVENGDE